MNQVVYAGKIEKGKLVKYKMDTKFLMASTVEAVQKLAEVQPCIAVDGILYPDGGADVPGGHS